MEAVFNGVHLLDGSSSPYSSAAIHGLWNCEGVFRVCELTFWVIHRHGGKRNTSINFFEAGFRDVL